MENKRLNPEKKGQAAALYVAMVTAFITTFNGSALNLAIPAIGEEFHSGADLLGWIVTAYMLASAVLSVPFGRYADINGRTKILKIGIFIFMLSSLLSTFSPSMPILLGFRVLQGLGGAMIFATNTAILISCFPPEKKGKVLGYSVAATYTGLTAGPVAGGFLNHWLGWRSIFLFSFCVGLLIFIIALRRLQKEEKNLDTQTSTDLLGNLLYISAITAVMYGLSSLSSNGYAKYVIAAGLILCVLFVRHELKVKYPIIDILLFTKNIAFTLSNLAALMNYGATFALGYLLSIYLQTVQGYSSQTAGFILISQPLIMAILSPYAGKLSDKISPFKLASAGMAISAIGLCVFIFIKESTSLWLIIPTLMFIGAGFAFFSSPNTNAVMSCVEQKDYGVASSILATMRSMGHTLSMVIVTLIVSMQMSNTQLSQATPTQIIGTMKVSFVVFTAICVIGVFFSLKRNSKKNKSNSN